MFRVQLRSAEKEIAQSFDALADSTPEAPKRSTDNFIVHEMSFSDYASKRGIVGFAHRST